MGLFANEGALFLLERAYNIGDMSTDKDLNNSSSGPEKKPALTIHSVRRLLELTVPYRGILVLAGLLMLFSTGITLSMPLLARAALDRVLRTHQVAALDRLAAGMLGLILLSSLIGFVEYLLVSYAGNRIVMDMRIRLFSHLQQMPVAFFDKARSGDLTSHLSNDVTVLQQTLTDDLVRLAGQVVTLVGGVVMAVVIDWRLTLIVVSLLAAVLGMFMLFGRRVRKLSREHLDSLSVTMGTMSEALSNVRLVKAFARETHENDRAKEKLQQTLRLGLLSGVYEIALWTAASAGFFLVLIGVVWYGGRSVLQGGLSGGALLAFLVAVYIISGPMASLASLYGRLQRSVGAADRLFALLDDAPEAPDPTGALPFPDRPASISFENVEFSYVPETPVIRDLTLEIPAGKVTALVGASGAGKTTLALLLYRFYELNGGEILLAGIPINQIARQALREGIGLVPQEAFLFNGTIRENIRYGKLTATDEEIEQAARTANVEEFVLPLAQGYETTLGERGVTLSGGQRQRVAIARAVLKDPRILILDEATSALDTHSERLVREALDRLMQGRTTIVIAHRLTTIQNADQIVVLDGGRVAELGRHEELLERQGIYARLHALGNWEEAIVASELPGRDAQRVSD
jgi:subfamily B ATP-binding cassette protein MsbA